MHDERDDLTDDDVVAPRERVEAKLGQIAEQAKQALADTGIDITLFFLAPHSGDAIIIFGTSADPPHDQWEQVRTIVSAIVREATRIGHTRCREIACASTTNSIADPWHSSVQSAGLLDSPPMTLPTVSLQEAGADSR